MAAFLWLLALTLRSTVILLVALVLGTLLHRASAVARHRLLTLTALGLLLLPALPRVLPRWEIPLGLPPVGTSAVPDEARQSDRLPSSAPLADAPRSSGPERPMWGGLARLVTSEEPASSVGTAAGTAIVILWLAGVLASLARLGQALHRERRLLAGCRPLDGPWRDTLAEAQRSLAVSGAVRLLVSEEVETPLTGGWPRPAVLLPVAAACWPDERRRLVAQHELVHVVRGDVWRHLAWRLAAALYWFHPLVRLAARRARLESEHACDETVVGLGARPSTYARHLLEISEALRPQPLGLASALPMMEHSQLERRLVMILDATRSPSTGRAAAAVGLALLAGTVVGAAVASPFRPARAESVTAAAPESKAAEPAPSASGDPVCLEGMTGTFTGTFKGRRSESDHSGFHDDDFSLQHHLGDGQRLCARIHGAVRFDERAGTIRELPPGASVEIETSEGRNRSQRMLISGEPGGPRYQWWRNGAAQTIDDPARAWLADALAVVAAFRAIGSLQGQVGSLQGAIGSIQGEVGSLQGQIGSIQGEEGSLQGKIGSIQGELGSLQGAIGSHQGAIGGLQGARWRASAALLEQIEREIKQHEAAIRKLEEEMATRGFERRIAAAEAELRTFQQGQERRIADLRRQIEAVHAESRIDQLRRQIDDLHADDRIEVIKREMKPALERLKAHIHQLGD